MLAKFTTRNYDNLEQAKSFLLSQGWEQLTPSLFRLYTAVTELRMSKGEVIAKTWK